LRPGLPIPPITRLAATHGVATSTALRAVKLLADWGLVEINTGRPTLVRQVRAAKEKVPNTADSGRPAKAARHAATAANEGSEPLDWELRRLGEHVYSMRVNANPDDAQMLGQLLADAIRRTGGNASDIGDYDLVVRPADKRKVVTVYAVAAGRGSLTTSS